MATVKPFRGLRPRSELAEKVASPPYDVINSEEAREMAKGNPYSFLHVNKPEIDLDSSVDIYDERVHEQGAINLKKLVKDDVLIQDEKPCFYLYRQTMGDHQQTGLVAVTSVNEYDQNKIKKHELTRIDKENDRMKHILSLNAQTGPVFLTYRATASNIRYFKKLSEKDPVYNFVTDDQIRHTFWVLDDETIIRKIEREN